MRKIKFDNSRSLAFQQQHVGSKIPDVLKLEGWLVDDHVCVQKPLPEDDAGWRISLSVLIDPGQESPVVWMPISISNKRVEHERLEPPLPRAQICKALQMFRFDLRL